MSLSGYSIVSATKPHPENNSVMGHLPVPTTSCSMKEAFMLAEKLIHQQSPTVQCLKDFSDTIIIHCLLLLYLEIEKLCLSATLHCLKPPSCIVPALLLWQFIIHKRSFINFHCAWRLSQFLYLFSFVRSLPSMIVVLRF